MRQLLMGTAVAVVIGAVVIAGGRGDDFPTFEGQRHGYPSVTVSDRERANDLCRMAHDDWPDEWSTASDAVYLDEPGASNATVCVRPGAIESGTVLTRSSNASP